MDLEEVYYSMLGELEDEFTIPWVENVFTPGSRCEENYSVVLDAYKRLVDRLGMSEDDEDIETIINALLENQRIVGLQMFRYGVLYEKKKPRP